MHLQVHRGVYVAAEILYERFKPMVEEQLASSPFAKVAFTVSSLLVCYLSCTFMPSSCCHTFPLNIRFIGGAHSFEWLQQDVAEMAYWCSDHNASLDFLLVGCFPSCIANQ